MRLLSCSCSSKLPQFQKVWPTVDRPQNGRGHCFTFDISQVSYFWWVLGAKLNQCAKVSRFFDDSWIFGHPGKFWPKRRRMQFMPRGWIFQKWNHFHDKTTHWDDENIFFKKSWGCYQIDVVQNYRSFGRFDRQLTEHELDAQEVLRSNQLPKCEANVP